MQLWVPGYKTTDAHTGKIAVDPLKPRVEKLRVVYCMTGRLYWHLGFDNYAMLELDDSGSSYTLVSQC